jgi:OPA family sugar phosphate sensor protein UhpC-like MFS transporter
MSGYSIALSTIVVLCIITASCYDLFFSSFGIRTYSFRFRAKRWSIWFPLGITYACFYAARYGIIAGNIPAVRKQLGYKSEDFGVVLTFGFWTYAITAPFMGWVCDYLGGRTAVLVSVAGGAATNFVLGGYIVLATKPHIAVVTSIYCLSMASQGLGTSSIIQINSCWYRKEEIGVFSGVFNVMVNAGYFLALGVCPPCVKSFGFSAVFFLPAFVLVVMGLILGAVLESAPQSLAQEKQDQIQGQRTSRSDLKRERKALWSVTFIAYLAAIMGLCWVKDGLLSWAYLFLESIKQGELSTDTTALLGFAITLGGFGGGFFINMVAQRMFSGQRAPALLLFSLLQLASLLLFWTVAVEELSNLAVAFFFFLTATFMLGSYSALSFLVPADLPESVRATGAGRCSHMFLVAYLS